MAHRTFPTLKVIGCDIFDDDANPIAHIDPQEEQPSQTVAAYARLFSAAPELLAALQALANACHEARKHLILDDDKKTVEALKSARAAIRKATGE